MKQTTDFKIIDGGKLTARRSPGKFISAEAVQSRLMGVTGFVLKRQYDDFDTFEICYFDAEEYGFDTYRKFIIPHGKELDEVDSELKKRFGGLGSPYVDITEREAVYMMQHYAEMNRRKGGELPPETSECARFLAMELDFSKEEEFALLQKICKEPENDFELVNYFVMRCAGNDPVAAKFLCSRDASEFADDSHGVRPLGFIAGEPCALIRNAVDYVNRRAGNFICESLLDYSGKYFNAVSLVQTDDEDMVVTGCRRVSIYQVTPQEAAIITRKNTFVRIGQLCNPAEDPIPVLKKVFDTALVNRHENGYLFTVFHPDNNHVRNQIFRLDEDVCAMVLVTFAGELIVSSDSSLDCVLTYMQIFPGGNEKSELDLLDGEYVDAYMFEGSLLPIFLDSPCFSFMQFLDLVSG